MSNENRRSDATDVLPAALLSRPSVRRGSVFSDLMTIFRRNSSHPNRLFHASRPSVSTSNEHKIRETEAFLESTASGQGQGQQEEEQEEDGKPMSRQVLLDKIRQKKEVIGKLRCQSWNMNRKRRTLRLAQKYLEQHESRVSKTHLYKEELKKKWRALCRWADNVKIYLIPWEAKIKRIESHFGSVVSSYFTFLRWVVYVNLMITLFLISFVVIPEMVADAAADTSRVNRTASRKIIPARERIHADEWQVVWHFDGYLKYSPLFYGYYSNDEFVGSRVRYAVPLAYFIITLFVFGYSCFAILRKMAINARLSKMSASKMDQYTFSSKLFTGWDYTIGNNDTASNTAMAILIKLRESIAECRVDSAKKFQPVQFLARVLANAVILAMLAFSIYTISFAVQSSETVEKTGSLFTKNQVPTIIATITHVFPMIFDLIGQIERYHPRTALRAHLTRVMVLYVLNYITFIIALFEKLDKIRGDELMKIIDERQMNGRSKRFLSQPYYVVLDGQPEPSLATFFSRNFTGTRQADKFAETSLERFSNLYENSLEIRERTRRKPQEAKTRKASSRFPDGITVESQFGPVGLNNPNALLFNRTYPPARRRFQTIRLGPPPLPTFPIPPLPPKPTLITNILTELGPHWQSRSKLRPPKTTTSTLPLEEQLSSSRSTTRTPVKATKIPWSSRLKPIRKQQPTTTAATFISPESSPTIYPTARRKGLKDRTSSISEGPNVTVTETPKSSTGTSDAFITTYEKTKEVGVKKPGVSTSVSEDNLTSASPVSPFSILGESGTEEIMMSTRVDTSAVETTAKKNASATTEVSIYSTSEQQPTIGYGSAENATQVTESNVIEVILEAVDGNETLVDWNMTISPATISTVQVMKSETEAGTTEDGLAIVTYGNLVNDSATTETKLDVRKESVTSTPPELVTVPDQIAEPLQNWTVTAAKNDTYSEALGGVLANETMYRVGQKARITTEEAEMENHFCWETMIGQEIVKLVTMDLIITIASIFIIDFFRGLWIKYCSAWWCWDIETTFPEYGEFKVAENVLHIINNQGMVWLGLFFAPLLPALNNLKLIVLMYIRAWACMACNVPAREIFRASRSSNFYLMVLLLWLLLCTLPVGYVIASKRPSSTCGPFAGYAKFYNVLTKMLEGRVDRKVLGWLRYIASPGVVIPVLLLLMLIIYFLVSLVRGLRKANNDLQQQLIHERTEEKKKIFELAGGGVKKKVTDGGREKKKQVVTYLPLVEQKRREPWRAYNGREYDSSLCVTDETSTVTTPGSDRSPSPKTAKKKQSTVQMAKEDFTHAPQQVRRQESVKRTLTPEKKESKGLLPSSTSNVTDRADDWFNEDTLSETHSYNVGSNVVEEVTPEEVRRAGGSSVIGPSQRSSRHETETGRIVVTAVAPVHQPRSSSGSQVSTTRIQPVQLGSRAGSVSAMVVPEELNDDIPLPKTSSGSSRKSSVKEANHDFVPWPSMEEAQASALYQLHQEPMIAESGRISRRTLADQQHRLKAPGSNIGEDAPTTSQQQQRRFRISVSPTRRLQAQTDPSESDTDTSTGKRRYVIKQEVLPDSTISVNADSKPTQQQPQQAHFSRAPVVQFGEDDSPKVHQRPAI